MLYFIVRLAAHVSEKYQILLISFRIMVIMKEILIYNEDKVLGMKYDHSSSYSKKDGSATFESDVFYLTIDKKSGN